MVMETPPSPQCVGREFVRQYYTLLNEAPAHLHRFYNNSSSFIHGGLDAPNRETTPVVGQKQIHQRIQQLNFRDCHAKISQVDSQATLGNGVVVQVTGELSNAGQPMRRFTQTFVLAAQSPKKYYVHNDIFRYQDMLTDEELEAEMTRSEVEEDHEVEQPGKNEIHKSEVQNNVSGYYGNVTQVVNGSVEPIQREEVVVQAPPAPVHESSHSQSSHPVNSIDLQQTQMMSPEQNQIQSTPNSTGYIAPEEQPEIVQDEQEQQSFHPQQQIESVTEPKTYATLVKSGGQMSSGGGVVYYNNSATSTSPQSQPKSSSPPPSIIKSENRMLDNRTMQGPKPPRTSDTLQRNNFQSSRQQTNDDNGNYGGGADGDRRRPNPQYSDSHQLFMGNLPHTATEPELRELFGKYGTIVDLRVLSKAGGKGPGSTRVPNYGFIIFEDINSVQAALNDKPILFPDESGVKLNVEEKKAKRGGAGGEGGRGGPRGGPQIRGGMMGPPRGGRGGATGMRFHSNSNRR